MVVADYIVADRTHGGDTVHAEGVALIHDWIAAMPGSCQYSVKAVLMEYWQQIMGQCNVGRKNGSELG